MCGTPPALHTCSCTIIVQATGKPTTMWCSRWKRRFGWRERRLTAPGHYLPYDHVKMEKFRTQFSTRLRIENIHPKLVLNYDQIWRVRYRGYATKLWKSRTAAGKQATRTKPTWSKRQRAVAQKRNAEGDCDVLVEEDSSTKRRKKGCGEEVCNIPILGQRNGYTVVTSLWANGDQGPLVFVFAENTMPKAVMQRLNDAYRGEIFIMSSGKENNHMMDAESTVQMWQKVYGPAFSKRRTHLGLTRQAAKGRLMFDAFTGNASTSDGTDRRRQVWLGENNITTMQGDGGWSVHGQPADCIHAYLRRLTDNYEDVLYGFSVNPLKRKRLEESHTHKFRRSR